jgi:hypothetical protein
MNNARERLEAAAKRSSVRGCELCPKPHEIIVPKADLRTVLDALSKLSVQEGAAREDDWRERVTLFLSQLADADLDELAADGGVTVGMVFQQQAAALLERGRNTK